MNSGLRTNINGKCFIFIAEVNLSALACLQTLHLNNRKQKRYKYNITGGNQLAIYENDRSFELRTTEKQIQLVVRAGHTPRIAGLRFQSADHSVTPPPKNDELCRNDRLVGNGRQDLRNREKTAIEACGNSIQWKLSCADTLGKRKRCP